MNENNRVLPIIFSIIFLIGFMVGVCVVETKYDKDTYDCTVKCPNNSHSIFFDNACYCKVGE